MVDVRFLPQATLVGHLDQYIRDIELFTNHAGSGQKSFLAGLKLAKTMAQSPETVKYIHGTLAQFANRGHLYQTEKEFAKFLELLPLFDLFISGGLAAINLKISELLNKLRGVEPVRELVEPILTELNTIIYGLIFVCPYHARSIRIVLNPKATLTMEQLLDKYGCTRQVQHRSAWEYLAFCSKMQEKYEDYMWQQVLSLPLPFSVIPQPLAECARNSAKQSIQGCFAFTHLHPEDAPCDAWIPGIAVALQYPLLCFEHTFFEIQEVARITIQSHADNLTPYTCENRQNEFEADLVERTTYLANYLSFREFRRMRNFRTKDQFPGISELEWSGCCNLIEPPLYSNLWVTCMADEKSEFLEHGFLIDPGTRDNFMHLYELQDVALPSRDRHVAAADLLIGIYRYDQNLMNHVTSHTTSDMILRRLTELPPKEQRRPH